jgi:hypothetical protein
MDNGEDMKLYIGEYEVPNDCRAMVSGGKVYVFRRITNKGRPKSTSLHCKDCEHRILGYACGASNHKTHICELHPKTVYYGRKKLFYAASKYGEICDNFKKKEL